MIKRMLCISMLCVLLMSMFAFFAPAARAQQAEASKQPVVYTYVSFFGVPRAQWGAYEKNATSEHKVFDGLLADGTILSYGDGALEVHEGANAPTHVGWFTSSSMAGLMKAFGGPAVLRSTVVRNRLHDALRRDHHVHHVQRQRRHYRQRLRTRAGLDAEAGPRRGI